MYLKTGLIYKANCLTRTNIIGVMNANGRVVTSGVVRNLQGLSANTTYYLTYPVAESMVLVIGAGSTNYAVRYDATNFARAQSFLGVADYSVLTCIFSLGRVANKTGRCFIELRGDTGGVPNNTIYAVSDSVLISDIIAWSSTSRNSVSFRMGMPTQLASGTYHLCLQTGDDGINTTDYLTMRGSSSGSYTDGQLCVCNSGGVWSAVAGADAIFSVVGANLNRTGSNLTATHPFSSLTADSIIAGKVWELGKTGADKTVLNVAIKEKPILTIWSDQTTELSVTGKAVTRVELGSCVVPGVEKLAIMFRAKSSTSATAGTVVPEINYQTAAGGASTQALGYAHAQLNLTMLTTVYQGVVNLSCKMNHATAGETVSAKYFTLIGC